jgi:hypothetical protein
MADHNAQMYAQMADSHAQLAGVFNSFHRRAARIPGPSGSMAPVQPTGNAMGQTSQESSMSGLLGRQVGGGISSNGQSESTFANTRFGGQQ